MAIDAATVRKVARLARIAQPEETVEQLARELSGIMDWIEQLSEVDTDGVEPMTSAVHVPMPMRDDVVTEGGDPELGARQRAQAGRQLLRRAEGGRVMSDLTNLTLKAALDGLAAKSFSSVELTQAHLEAVEAARALNAYVLETPEQGAGHGQGHPTRAARRGEGGPLEGVAARHQGPVLHRGRRARPRAHDPRRLQAGLRIRPSPPTCGATAR